ncbi:DUF424 domain-containing protein [Natranaeroarchaeum sulfidigenes]|uniref:DUF424 domain-containing protein n=1 Tax=Natranaeroarchaeum sulfidigenes TaxID=2784880 RepID=A0A897MM44_9EURY|nr:DUF424 domain-containing protein [Natranaeroarchaeum sulfidigenes]QSG01452.1 Uncharacterized protein AArcS_0217 [Natranaeroarchaeum sulfidigenes]
MIVSERTTEKGLLVTVCDPETLGETYESGDISLTVTEEFYGGEEVTEDAVVDSLSRATIANIVGTEAVELAIEHGYVDEANVLELESTLHAQVLRLA